MNNTKCVDIIYIDFAKAFDVLTHLRVKDFFYKMI